VAVKLYSPNGKHGMKQERQAKKKVGSGEGIENNLAYWMTFI
jgi:hypothetical protein